MLFRKPPVMAKFNPVASKVALDNRRISNVPGSTGFHKAFAGQPVSGWSGIIPFARTRSGKVVAPASSPAVNFAKLFPGRG